MRYGALMYGKAFASMYEGSMFGAGMNVFAVWNWVLAVCDQDGLVNINPPVVAVTLGGTVEEVQSALDYLTDTDENSRSDAEDGRRLLRIKGPCYKVVNHAHYAKLRTAVDRREYKREWARKNRLKKKSVDTSSTRVDKLSTESGQAQTVSTHKDVDKDVHVQEDVERESPAKPATRASEPEYSAEVIEIAQYLYDAISEHSPDAFSSNPKKVEALLLGWCKAIDLGMRKGTKATKSERGFNGPNMTLAGAKAVIDLAHRGADDFWHRNMISGSSLRNCYARLVIEARKAYSAKRSLEDFDYVGAAERFDEMLRTAQ